jgi:hypothetical protein
MARAWPWLDRLGTIATFITLYYASREANAALTLSLFGASFISARLLFGNLINRIGGFRRAPACRWKHLGC